MDGRKTLGFAVVGVGMVAETHLRAIADLTQRVVLCGVFSRTSEHASQFAVQASEMLGYDIEAYETIDAITADARVDVVLVLTPPNARAEVVSKFAKAGKALLLEKPIERDTDAALRIVEVCESADVPLGVVFQHRTRAASVALADLIETGTLGDLALVEARVPWWRPQSYYDEPGRGTFARDGGGVLISQAIHTLDLMMSLAGPVSEVQAMSATTSFHQMEAEDFVSAGLRFTCGAVGSLVASTASFPGGGESLMFHFANGSAHLEAGVLRIDWRDGQTEVIGEEATTGGGADPMAFTHAWHRDVIEDFCDAIVEDRPPLVNGREGLRVHALIDALVASSSEKRAMAVNYPENVK